MRWNDKALLCLLPFQHSTCVCIIGSYTHAAIRTELSKSREGGVAFDSFDALLFFVVVVVIACNVCSAAGVMALLLLLYLALHISLWVLESVCALCNCN